MGVLPIKLVPNASLGQAFYSISRLNAHSSAGVVPKHSDQRFTFVLVNMFSAFQILDYGYLVYPRFVLLWHQTIHRLSLYLI